MAFLFEVMKSSFEGVTFGILSRIPLVLCAVTYDALTRHYLKFKCEW